MRSRRESVGPHLQPARQAATLVTISRAAFSTYIIRSLPNLARPSAGSSHGKFGDDIEILEFEAERDDLLSETGEVVLVSSSDLFDQIVGAQPFHQAGDLARVLVLDAPAQVFVLEAADVELAAAQRLEQLFVLRIEEVEAPVVAVILLHWLG